MIALALASSDRLLLRRSYFVSCPASASGVRWWNTDWPVALRASSLTAPAGSVWTVGSSLDFRMPDQERAAIDELEALSSLVGSRHRLRVVMRHISTDQLQHVLDVAPPGVSIAVEIDATNPPRQLRGYRGADLLLVRVTRATRAPQLRRAIEHAWEDAFAIGALIDGDAEPLMDTIRHVEGFSEVLFTAADSAQGPALNIPGRRIPEVAA